MPDTDRASSTRRPHWHEVEPWLERALAVPDAERHAWLQAQALPAALHDELLALLQAEAASRGLYATADGDAAPVAPPALPAGTRVGAWRVVAPIGRGGSGEVYRVERADGSYQQQAALKLLRSADDADERRRFAAERHTLARLQVPGIVRLLDAGSHAGQPWAVTELIEGRPLDAAGDVLDLPGRLALLRRVVGVVAAAHAGGIVHRDLKPANVLVDAEGAPHLLDFGLARRDTGTVDGDATQTLSLRLTPDWCAPEQLTGGVAGPPADVFALGVLAYRLLAGRLPWALAGPGMQRALQRLQRLDDVPPPPSQGQPSAIRSALRGDLDAIVARCLAREPGQRYADAAALAEDLDRHARGLPVRARGDATTYVLGRLLRRHRVVAGAGAAVLLSLAGGLGATAWMAHRAAEERDLAQAESRISRGVRDLVITLLRDVQAQPAGERQPPSAVLARNAERLSASLADDPQGRETLLAMAQLYYQLNDYVGAAALYERLLADTTALSPEQRAQAEAEWAQCLWRMGRADEAAAPLARAQAYWADDPTRWRLRMAESRHLQAQLARHAGDAASAIALLEQALATQRELLGPAHVEVAVTMNNLAFTRHQTGDRAGARNGYQAAWVLWQQLGHTDGPDALGLLNNWAVLEMQSGQTAEAERLWQQAVDLHRAHLPPSAEQAALLNNLGKLRLRRGDAAGAEPLLAEAVAQATRFAGPASPHAMAALQGRAEALAALGREAEGLEVLADIEARASGAPPLAQAMPDLAWARWHAQARRWPEAHARADAAQARLQALGPAGAGHLAQLKALRAAWPAR